MPKVVSVVCAYCGAVKEVPAYYAGRYRTCGAPECVFQRRAEGGRKNAGKPRPEAVKLAVAEKLRGRPRPPGVHQKMVDARKARGAWFSDPEIGAKISAGKKGKPNPKQRGPDNPAWKGGITKLPQGYRGGPLYKEWQQIVLTRAGGRCERCGSEQNVVAHHLVEWQVNPRLRLDPDNGVALCRRCHGSQHSTVNNLPSEEGPWPHRPSVTTILCRYCGAPRYVQTVRVHEYATCGAAECVHQRSVESGQRGNHVGAANGRYKNGAYLRTEQVCVICGATFIGTSRRKFCSQACTYQHKALAQKGVRFSEERKAKMRGHTGTTRKALRGSSNT